MSVAHQSLAMQLHSWFMAIRRLWSLQSSTFVSCFVSFLHSFSTCSLLDTMPMLASWLPHLLGVMIKSLLSTSWEIWIAEASFGPLDCEHSTFHSLCSSGYLVPYPCFLVVAYCHFFYISWTPLAVLHGIFTVIHSNKLPRATTWIQLFNHCKFGWKLHDTVIICNLLWNLRTSVVDITCLSVWVLTFNCMACISALNCLVNSLELLFMPASIRVKVIHFCLRNKRIFFWGLRVLVKLICFRKPFFFFFLSLFNENF